MDGGDHRRLGRADADDQLAVCDWAVAEGLADPDRLAVHGLSYGGFMTSWLVGQTDRFRAAISVNGVSNQVSAAANCDLGALWTPRLGWGYPPDDLERLWAQSPLAHADRIRTPLLMLQGEADLRCPAADNEQLFTALRCAAGRSSTCCIRRSRTSCSRWAVPIGASTCSSARSRGSSASAARRRP